MTPFERYIRTGRVRRPDALELKFNPWHDPDNGRFTFRNSGTSFGGQRASEFAPRPNRNDPRIVRLGQARAGVLPVDLDRFLPENPRNHSIHIVKRGESIGSIARTRKGLRPHELAELNGIKNPNLLRVGQALKLPHQSYLDDGKRARDKFMALGFYMDNHGGRLPPNAANPPSIQSQVDTDWRAEVRNGVDFKIDSINRTRRISFNLDAPALTRRSRSSQRRAGASFRQHSDDGGHYVAPRLGGTHEYFNHFAQNANFNRGAYRVLEDKWAAYRKAGKAVSVVITPLYDGLSQRPEVIAVHQHVNGVIEKRVFKNRRGGR
jgi:LysM repeat protein